MTYLYPALVLGALVPAICCLAPVFCWGLAIVILALLAIGLTVKPLFQ